MDKTLLFIVNPRAGKTKSSAPLFDAVGHLRPGRVSGAGDADPGRRGRRRFAAQWGRDYDLVVCAGGDGTPSTRRCRA